ncbi:MAG TPA: TlpA disulfide reductase family protein [Hanamia sp.]
MIKRIKIFECNLALIVCILGAALLSLGCMENPVTLKNGYWRATIQRPDGQQIVFNFETKDSLGKKIIYVINGKEHLLVDSIKIVDDSVFIQMPFFESDFRARIMDNGNLEGTWVKYFGNRVRRMPFNAEYHNKVRFTISTPPVANISGRWVTEFQAEKKASTMVAEFEQNGSYLTGTFLDPTGDTRFLQGVVSGDSLKLSTFDGANAYLFTAKIDNKNKISGGKFYAGETGVEDWNAVRNANAKTTDPFSETKIKPNSGKLNFSFRDSKDGHIVSINDKRFKGKVLIIQILGSWCPNCMDETRFLSDYYNKNHQRGVEIIGLAYERTTDFENSQKALEPFMKKLHVQYPVLITGAAVSDSLLTQKTLPQLEKIMAFPTSIFVDKNGNIRKIDTGFSGPATGEHYTEFKKEFNKIINHLLAEK